MYRALRYNTALWRPSLPLCSHHCSQEDGLAHNHPEAPTSASKQVDGAFGPDPSFVELSFVNPPFPLSVGSQKDPSTRPAINVQLDRKTFVSSFAKTTILFLTTPNHLPWYSRPTCVESHSLTPDSWISGDTRSAICLHSTPVSVWVTGTREIKGSGAWIGLHTLHTLWPIPPQRSLLWASQCCPLRRCSNGFRWWWHSSSLLVHSV